MTALPPPQGMSEADYESIEAAVTETVRGRWFLGEFARRNRAAEMRQILEAVGRLETIVATAQLATAPQMPAPSDPSIRLMMQRIKEIAGHLDALSGDMRDVGIEPRFVEGIDAQARAVAGMMRAPARGAPSPRGAVGAPPVVEPRLSPPPKSLGTPAMPRADLPPALSLSTPPRETAAVQTGGQDAASQNLGGQDLGGQDLGGRDAGGQDAGLSALSALDTLAFAKKIALFS